MRQTLNFKRNVYVILICILLFGIMSQISRSDWMLKYTSYDSEYILEQFNKMESFSTNDEYQVVNTVAVDINQHCIIYDSEDDVSLNYLNNFKEVYRYLKQPFVLYDIKSDTIVYDNCDAAIIMADFEKIPNVVEDLDHYIFNGGNVFISKMGHPGSQFSRFYRKLGIVNYTYIVGNNHIEMTSNILLGNNGQKFDDFYFYNDSLQVELDNSAKLLAQGETSPLIWSNQYGDGNIVVYNGNNLYIKIHRGLIIGSIGLLIPEYIYPIFNSKLFYIDDYPAPMSTEENEKIADEYNRNVSSFYKSIWWPDMIEVSKKHNIKYTAVAILDYNDVTEAPLPKYRQEDLTNMIIYGREVLKLGGEIGIHGYNHQPLQFDKAIADGLQYRTWSSYEDMEISIQDVVAYLKEAFPNYEPVSYVPPSNILSGEGRQALINNWDSLKVISSLYEEDYLNRSYIQEFEVSEEGIIEMPRITSGYADSPDMRWLEASIMTAHGFLSHFIHPDDIFDDYRSGNLKWSELFEEFDFMLNRINKSYPWLEAKTSGEAAYHVASVLKSNITREYEGPKVKVSIDEMLEPQYFIFRTDKDIARTEHCTVRKVDEDTYLVKAVKPDFYIEVK